MTAFFAYPGIRRWLLFGRSCVWVCGGSVRVCAAYESSSIFFGGLRFWGSIDEAVPNLGLLVILRVIVVVFPSFFGGFITSRKSRENIGCDGRRIDAARCFTNI